MQKVGTEYLAKRKKMKKSNWHGGKGSGRRNSNEQAYRDNWDEIFGKTRANINTRNKEKHNGTNKNK